MSKAKKKVAKKPAKKAAYKYAKKKVSKSSKPRYACPDTDSTGPRRK
jgi:hypothetical protein